MPGKRNPGTRDAKAIYGAKENNAVEDDSLPVGCDRGFREPTEVGEMFG